MKSEEIKKFERLHLASLINVNSGTFFAILLSLLLALGGIFVGNSRRIITLCLIGAERFKKPVEKYMFTEHIKDKTTLLNNFVLLL